MGRLDRMLGILLLLSQGRTWPARQLAERFEVSVRTIHRDLGQLSAVGVPVYAERGALGGFRLLPGYTIHPVNFTRSEAVSLVLAVTFLKSLPTGPYRRALETAAAKLLAALPGELRTTLAHADRLLGFEGPTVDIFHPEAMGESEADVSAILDAFLDAILDRRIVHMVYRSPYRGGTEELTTIPQALLRDRERWYLVGRSGASGEVRLFRADRTVRVAAGRLSPVSVDVDVRHLLGRTWLDHAMHDWASQAPVRIEMSAALARRLRADWYFGRALFAAAGEDRVVMTYGESDRGRVFELMRWLGSEAELLTPADWRPLFSQELESTKSRYAARVDP